MKLKRGKDRKRNVERRKNKDASKLKKNAWPKSPRRKNKKDWKRKLGSEPRKRKPRRNVRPKKNYKNN